MIKARKFKKKYYNLVYDFLYNNYSSDRKTGLNASFFEYAYYTAMNKKYLSKNTIFFDDKKIVAFISYEKNIGEAFFSYLESYDYLISDMIEYAEKNLKDKNEKILMHPFSSQVKLRNILKEKGYKIIDSQKMNALDYQNEVEALLPFGYSFLEDDVDYKKLELCLYKGFDHGETLVKYHPKKIMKVFTAPHATADLNKIIVNSEGDYVCFAGMWLEKKNNLAYLEPLCTIPSERKKGLAKAIISKLQKETRKLEANIMTGGADDFYTSIGFKEIYRDELWEKR